LIFILGLIHLRHVLHTADLFINVDHVIEIRRFRGARRPGQRRGALQRAHPQT